MFNTRQLYQPKDLKQETKDILTQKAYRNVSEYQKKYKIPNKEEKNAS